MQEMQAQSLGREEPLEEEMATHSSILPWRIPWTEEPGGLQPMGSQRVRQDRSDAAQEHTLRGRAGRQVRSCCPGFFGKLVMGGIQMKGWNSHWGRRSLGVILPDFHPSSIFARGEVDVCETSGAQSCLTLCNPMDCSPPGSSPALSTRRKDFVFI